ncbi:ATP-binding protein [Pelomonas sp. SE-A7]|uniref:ATP-binding protein n=1 Tax=Pelomonas sp. SE-A7 TaxID=3054953 RepID=UPI00259C8348|nr:ATP-binding protein [Pelomonas sp. SE-A7]MDM4765181.1 ATP-binding protein [Pelomonas sp. SE-A7]
MSRLIAWGLMPRSLRNRLVLILFALLSLAALLQGGSAYRNALAETDEIFDYQMQQMAFSLRGDLVSGSGTVSVPLGEDQSFDFLVQVWSLSGTPLFRSPGEDWLPQRAVLGFSEVDSRGKRYRVFSMQTRYQVVQIAQDLSVRSRMARQLALRTVAPVALMLPLLALSVWWVVSASLNPVSRVREQLAQRRPDDLTPVPDHELPSEVQPLVREMNSLLERVRAAFEAQQHFVADAAHELRSPLAALKLQLESLQRAGGDEERAAAFQRLGTGIDRAAHLIEQLLLLARAEGREPAAVRSVDLESLCREAVVEASDPAREKQIDLGLEASEALTAHGQPEALRILLRNLLDNAIKYTPAGGRVDLSLSQAGSGRALLLVEDSGPGIASEDSERVFDRFYRGNGQLRAQGAGLGLAIVKAIADRHGAKLELDRSRRLGGLAVRVLLPRGDAAG